MINCTLILYEIGALFYFKTTQMPAVSRNMLRESKSVRTMGVQRKPGGELMKKQRACPKTIPVICEDNPEFMWITL